MLSKQSTCFGFLYLSLVIFNAIIAVYLESQDKPYGIQVVLVLLSSCISVYYFNNSKEGK